MFGYRVPDADEVMLISGGRKTTQEAPFRIERGAKFVIPGLRKVSFLPLSQQQAKIDKDTCTTRQGLGVNVTAVVSFKISPDDPSIFAAGQRFKDDLKENRGGGGSVMAERTGQIFSGHLRSIVGAMTLEEIITERQKLADQVLDASKTEMAKMGLAVDSFQITHIDDLGSGYIQAMAAPHNAKIQQEAAVAQAQADQIARIAQSKANQAAAEAEQESLRNQAEFQRTTAVAKAKMQADVDTEMQTAAQAGPLASARANQAVLAEQTLLATRQADLREATLQAERIRPAKAEAEVVRIQAEAEAARTTIQADADAHRMQAQASALAAEGKVTLDRMLVEQLPQLVNAAAQTLRGANVTVFNGAEGVNQMLTAALGQGLSVFNTLRGQLDNSKVMEDNNNEMRRIEDMANGPRP